MTPATMIFEPMSLCMVMGLYNAWAVNYMFDISPMSFMLVHILIWFLMDFTMMKIIEVRTHCRWLITVEELTYV